MRDPRRQLSVSILSAHAALRQGIAALLRELGQVQVIECHEYVHARTRKTDVAFVDLDAAPIDAMRLVQQLRVQLEDVYMVVMGSATRIAAAVDDSADAELESVHADANALRAAIARKPLRASAELARAHRLWAEVTPRQRDVLRWLAAGSDNPAISDHMRVTERAVKAHVSSLLALFGCANRTQLALLAQRAGLKPVR